MRTGGPKDFWKIIKSVSVADIARDANRPVSVAIVGLEERREEATRALFAADVLTSGEAPAPLALPSSPYVQGYDNTGEEAKFPRQSGVYDFVIDVGGGRQDVPEGTLVYSIAELGGWEKTLDRILEDKPDLALPLARNFPVFRKRVAQQIVTQTATANAQFALLTGVVSAFPITDILLPGSAFSDIVVLTKNQAMMVLRLAAAYGLEIDYKSRWKEIAPILANAVGWRAIAREIVGAIPFGIGFLPKAGIAYAGTVTVGKAAQLYYETGEQLTAAQARRLYKEVYASSREKIRALAENFKNGRGGGGRKTLAAAPAATIEEAEPSRPEREAIEASGE